MSDCEEGEGVLPKMQWKVGTPDAEASSSWPTRESEGGDTFQIRAWVLPT